MNNSQRQQSHFDDVAEQAKDNGFASVGPVKASQRNAYEQAANDRDCTFVIDAEGTGLFLDDSQCRWDDEQQQIVFF